ncbi:MAG: hypothetical protein VCB43_02500 [Myxococcota bacterium]
MKIGSSGAAGFGQASGFLGSFFVWEALSVEVEGSFLLMLISSRQAFVSAPSRCAREHDDALAAFVDRPASCRSNRRFELFELEIQKSRSARPERVMGRNFLITALAAFIKRPQADTQIGAELTN